MVAWRRRVRGVVPRCRERATKGSYRERARRRAAREIGDGEPELGRYETRRGRRRREKSGMNEELKT